MWKRPIALLPALVLPGLVLAAAGCHRTLPPGPTANADEAKVIRGRLLSGAGPENGGAAERDLGEGWASLAGQFTLAEGAEARGRQPLSITKDRAVCAPGGGTVLDRVMLVDEQTRGIANVLVFLREAPRVHPSLALPEEPLVFDQRQCIFLDHVFAVQAGRSILIKNSDPVLHNTNIVAVKNEKFNVTIPTGESVPYKMERAERVPVGVSCSIHPWMSAYMMSCENAYFAITDREGRFRIDNLPAGVELEFQAWHENQSSGINGGLGLNHPELPWTNKGRFRITLTQDQAKEIAVECPGTAFN